MEEIPFPGFAALTRGYANFLPSGEGPSGASYGGHGPPHGIQNIDQENAPLPKEKYPPLDRSVFSVVDLKDADNDLQYWLSRTPQERLAAIEIYRRMMYGYDRATSRLQKFLEVVDLDEC